MYLSLHSLKELAHDPADNFMLSQRSFKIPHQVLFLIYPDVVTEFRMPVPYDTLCMEQKACVNHNNVTYSSRECYESCYSSHFMRAHEAFPYDSPQFIRTNKKLKRTINGTDSPENEKMKQLCHSRCRNDCHQVHFTTRYDTISFLIPKVNVSDVFFEVKKPQQEIVIRYSAQVSFWDLMSVILNSANFYFTFCPATLLLSNRLLLFFKINNRRRRRFPKTRHNRNKGRHEMQEFQKRGIKIAWA